MSNKGVLYLFNFVRKWFWISRATPSLLSFLIYRGTTWGRRNKILCDNGDDKVWHAYTILLQTNWIIYSLPSTCNDTTKRNCKLFDLLPRRLENWYIHDIRSLRSVLFTYIVIVCLNLCIYSCDLCACVSRFHYFSVFSFFYFFLFSFWFQRLKGIDE